MTEIRFWLWEDEKRRTQIFKCPWRIWIIRSTQVCHCPSIYQFETCCVPPNFILGSLPLWINKNDLKQFTKQLIIYFRQLRSHCVQHTFNSICHLETSGLHNFQLCHYENNFYLCSSGFEGQRHKMLCISSIRSQLCCALLHLNQNQ